VQGRRSHVEVHHRVRREYQLQGSPPADLRRRKQRADLRQQHSQRRSRPAAFHGLRASRFLFSHPAAATTMAAILTTLAVHAAG
jgi:hypothetical protein